MLQAKVEGKFVTVRTKKAYGGSESIAPVVKLGIRWRWVVSITTLPLFSTLPPRKESPIFIKYEAGWALALLWAFWRTDKSAGPPDHRGTIWSTSRLWLIY